MEVEVKFDESFDPKKVTQACIEGRSMHSYDKEGKCKFCGYQRPYPEKKGSTSRPAPPSTARAPVARPAPTRANSGARTSDVPKELQEKPMADKDVRALLSFGIAIAQKAVVAQAPFLKEDELNPFERLVLADALAEELKSSRWVQQQLAKLAKQKKHAKLGMALVIISVPRMVKHGMMPEEMLQSVSELATPLAQQYARDFAAASQAAGPGGAAGDQPVDSFMSIPVAAGGPPEPHRGNGVRQVDLGGVVAEAAPLRGGASDEAGRDPIRNGSDRIVPPGDVQPSVEPDRAEATAAAVRPEEG